MGGWLFHYSFKCQPVDYSDNPIAMRVSLVMSTSPVCSSDEPPHPLAPAPAPTAPALKKKQQQKAPPTQ